MKRPLYGPSIYYATDKNVFDALNQHKVTKSAIQLMFLRRNIIVSRKAPRVDLASYFALLSHDYVDHQDIANRLGIVARRERTTSMTVNGIRERQEVLDAIEDVKKALEESGDTVNISKYESRVVMTIQYSTVDYRRSEFTQTQHHKGRIEFLGTGPLYTLRSTDSDHVIKVREEILERLSKASQDGIQRSYISLQLYPSPEDRSQFFNDLINELDGFTLYDVKEAFAYKARPDRLIEEPDEDEDILVYDEDEADAQETGGARDSSDDEQLGSHVEHVNLKGFGVTRSNFLLDALDDDYYLVRIRWEAKRSLGLGQVYIIDALFDDPKHCDHFSFILRGTFPFENGRLSSRQAAPSSDDIDEISRAIEKTAQRLLTQLKAKHSEGASEDGDAL
jgi:hypothetical protein